MKKLCILLLLLLFILSTDLYALQRNNRGIPKRRNYFTIAIQNVTVSTTGITSIDKREDTLFKLVSDGGEVNITTNPQIVAGKVDGQIIILKGTSDVNTIIFEDGNGLSMSASVTLGNKDILSFYWDSSDSLWIMLYANTK